MAVPLIILVRTHPFQEPTLFTTFPFLIFQKESQWPQFSDVKEVSNFTAFYKLRGVNSLFPQKGGATGHPVSPSKLQANIGIAYVQSNVVVKNRNLPDKVCHASFLHPHVGWWPAVALWGSIRLEKSWCDIDLCDLSNVLKANCLTLKRLQ